MCLAIPGYVVEVKGAEALVDFMGARKTVNISLLDDVSPGDYVIVHVGFAIQKLSPEEAEESLRLWEGILRDLGICKWEA